MKTLRRMGLGMLTGLALLTASCEHEGQDPEPVTPLANDNQGLDNFYLGLSNGHLYSGDSSEVAGTVRANCPYNVYVKGSNDGDSDRIGVYVNDDKLGEYITDDVRSGGHGWYEDQNSKSFRFSSTNENVNFKVLIMSADSWGTWPKGFQVDRVVSE